ncbi:MAG: hypothetical protein RL693_908 [Verrucomicrobiota bacterium]|jgi:hypothetical protein
MQPWPKNSLENLRNSLLTTYNEGSASPNKEFGSEREAFIQNFLKKIFPPRIRFVDGIISDAFFGARVAVDAAVLLPTAPSVPMPERSHQRLIPATNVAAVIEIKSNLETQWSETTSTARQIREMKKHFWSPDEKESCKFGEYNEIPVYVVAYEGCDNVWALKKKWEETEKAERPHAVLMIENPAFVSDGLWAEQDAAVIAFMDHLNRVIQLHEENEIQMLQLERNPFPFFRPQ